MSSWGILMNRISIPGIYTRRLMFTGCLRRVISPEVPRPVRIMFYRDLSSTTARNTVYNSPIPNINIKEESLAEYFLPKFERFGTNTALGQNMNKGKIYMETLVKEKENKTRCSGRVSVFYFIDDTRHVNLCHIQVDYETGKTYTYLEMREAVIKLGSALHRLGYRKGDVLCMCSTNNTEYALLILACVTSGIVLTTTNPAYTSAELARHIRQSGATGIVIMASHLSTLQEAIAGDHMAESKIKNIITLGEMDGYRSFSNLLEDDGACFPEDVPFNPKNDVALLPYSSGTSGPPKGVMLTHMNVVSNIQQIRPQLTITPDDTSLCLLPMFHIGGLTAVLMSTLQDGGKLVILPKFEPGSFLKSIQDHKVTVLYMVPPVALFLARHPLVDKFDISSVRFHLCAAAPLGESLCREYEDRLKYPICQGYGMTELSPFAIIDTLPPHHIGTVGSLIPNTSAKIVCPETGAPLGPGETGEVCIQGPQVMKGYLNNKEATNEMIRDGWLHTGDLGHVREDGCFVITDRLKELIKYKGMQVAPAELEDMLLRHPGVQDVAVIGKPDERAGEVPRAYIVPNPNGKVTREEISKFIEENAASYKHLRGGVEFLDEIPKSPSGKILKRIIRNML